MVFRTCSRKTEGYLLFLILALILAGCGPSAAPASSPTLTKAARAATATIAPSLTLMPMATPAPTETPTPVPTPTLEPVGAGAIQGLAWSADGQQLVVERAGGFQILGSATLGEIAAVPIDAGDQSWNKSGPYANAANGSDGAMRWLTWSIAEGTITVWDVATGVALRTISVLESAEEQFDAAALSADGTRVVTSNSNVNAPGLPHEWIKVWDVDSGEELKRFQKSRAWSGAQGMALSADGRYVARPLGPVYIAHLTTGESKVGLELYSMYDYVDAGSGHLLFSPDGRWVLAINGFQLLLWEAGTGRMVATPYLPFMNDASDPTSIIQPTAIAFNANSRTFAVGGDNGSLWIWNTRGEVVTRLAGHIAAVRALAFSPDSQFLASGGRDNTLIIWSVAAGEIVRQTASQ